MLDKAGDGIVGATVNCWGSAATPATPSEEYDTVVINAVDTGASGVLAEQTITARKWVGTSETLTTYSPHKFTISAQGYETLILENITIDGPIDWHLELQHVGGAKNKQIGLGVNI